MLQERLQRIEDLLFLADVTQIDDAIRKILHSACTSTNSTCAHAEPEVEQTPTKHVRGLDVPQSSGKQLMFNIYDDTEYLCQVGIQTDLCCSFVDHEDPVAKCLSIAQELRQQGEQLQIPIANNGEEFVELVLDKFGDLLEAAPLEPQTKISRDSFAELYDNMHREAHWNQVVKRYHNGTGDPESKSDVFIELMNVIHCLWKGYPLTRQSPYSPP